MLRTFCDMFAFCDTSWIIVNFVLTNFGILAFNLRFLRAQSHVLNYIIIKIYVHVEQKKKIFIKNIKIFEHVFSKINLVRGNVNFSQSISHEHNIKVTFRLI